MSLREFNLLLSVWQFPLERSWLYTHILLVYENESKIPSKLLKAELEQGWIYEESKESHFTNIFFKNFNIYFSTTYGF